MCCSGNRINIAHEFVVIVVVGVGGAAGVIIITVQNVVLSPRTHLIHQH